MFNKIVYIGTFEAGNILSYNYVFRGEYQEISTCIYTDKDISLLFYRKIPNLRKSDKIFINGYLKGDKLILQAYRNQEKEEFVIAACNIDIERFNELFKGKNK